MNPDLTNLINLSFPEKLKLVEDLWDHIASSDEPLPVPKWQKDELDRRKESFTADSSSAVLWEDAKKRIRGKS